MPITPTRFEISDKETNIVVKDFRSLDTSNILNSAMKGLATLTEAVKTISSLAQGKNLQNALKGIAANAASGIIGKVVSSAEGYVGKAISSAEGYVSRIAKDGISSVNTLVSSAANVIDKVASPLLAGMDSVKSIIRQVDATGYAQILSNAVNVVSTSSLLSQNGTVRKIAAEYNQATQYVGLVNSLCDNKYTGKILNPSVTERVVSSVTKQTSSIGLVGVFNAFEQSVTDPKGLVRAGVNLINYASEQKDSNLVLEIANSTIASSLLRNNPTIAATITNGIKLSSM
jgi:hypothetical protein